MKNRRREDRSGGRGDFKRRDFGHGRNKGFHGHNDGDKRMYRATCSDCGNECEVPFRPSGGRPIFCNDCFPKHRGNDGGGRPDRHDDKRMFRATCANCGNECEVPFRPSGDKPVYCKDCFGKMGKGRPQHDHPAKDMSGQFKTLNEKLDAILRALSSKPEAPAEITPEAKPKAKAKTTKKKRPAKV